MRNIRYISLAAVLSVLAWYLASTLPASASVPPADLPGDPVVGGLTAPSQPVIVHEQTAAWWFVLVAVAAVVATLAVVVAFSRLRRGSTAVA